MNCQYGGEGGIRTLGTGFNQYNGLANRPLQPLGYLSSLLAPTPRTDSLFKAFPVSRIMRPNLAKIVLDVSLAF